MSQDLEATLHSGSGFPAPVHDQWQPPTGEVTWLEAVVAGLSTSGPSLMLGIDFFAPRGAGREHVVVVRVRRRGNYLDTSNADWADPDGHLAATATVVVDGEGHVAQLPISLPYVVFPHGTGGIVDVEVAVHEPAGPLVAIATFDVELPAEVDRVPDLLTVTAHTLVALVRAADGDLTYDEKKVIRALLVDNFALDPLGESSLRRILQTAMDVMHTPDTLAEALAPALPAEAEERFVAMLYACARADGEIQEAEQDFVDALVERLGLHDHERYGSVALRPCFEELEIAPGSSWEEVRQAYKRMVRDYHPDRVQHLASGFQDYATRRLALINEAYTLLKAGLERAPTVEVEMDLGEEEA